MDIDMDIEEELNRILSEEIAKSIYADLSAKLKVLDKREQRKIDEKYRKREAKLKKMKRLLDSL